MDHSRFQHMIYIYFSDWRVKVCQTRAGERVDKVKASEWKVCMYVKKSWLHIGTYTLGSD